MAIDVTWIETVEARFSCLRELNSTELLNYTFYKRIQKLLVKCPDILDSDEEGKENLSWVYSKIACGQLFEEVNLMQFSGILALKEYQCEDEIAEAAADAAKIIASGIYTSTGTTTSQDIALTGVVATDNVTVTLHTQAGSELVSKAITAADKVTVTFSAAPTTATKVNYQVIRPAV